MKKYIGIFIAFIWIPQIGNAQTAIDSLQVSQLENIELITEIYSIPRSRYTLDHFLCVRKTDHVDPQVQYNKGERIFDDSKLFLKNFKPGDTLVIKEIYAVNIQSQKTSLVKLPEKMFVLK